MLSRSLLRLATRPQARQLHVSALCQAEKNGMFGRFNPWAKTEPTPEVAKASPTESIGNVTFDVDYHDDQEFSSWKNTDIVQDMETIQTSLRSIVSEHIQGVSDNDWQQASLVDADIKFKVVKAAIQQTGKEVPNLVLNNITSVDDLLAFYARVPDI
ncbi:hypothetical protein [Absidia glauca]|uniref:Large ribosomal subunit protein mL50 n=1 Tax=Absidia glauca TaxID=4829 RepID=A0A168LJZ3_ABSGL|nr:hypothetical protein [Absidia glauca]